MKARVFVVMSLALMFGILLALFLSPQSALAAGPWYVATTGDDGNDCLNPSTACATINGAIGKASSGDTVYVAEGIYTGTSSEVMLVDRDISLSGGWDESFTAQNGFTTIDGQNSRRGVLVNSGVSASLDHFVVRNGFYSAYYGGGIYSDGNLTITNSSIQSNSIGNLCYGGGIFFNGSFLAIENTTIGNNSAGCNGGGVFSGQITSTVTINNSTISNNQGGGVYNNGVFILSNTIISRNTIEDCNGVPFTSQGNNIISNTNNCTISAVTDDQFNVDPQLGPFLPEYGFFPLMSSSSAIDTGNPASCLPTDQRGVTRDSSCDIGAFEYTIPGTAQSLSVAGGSNQVTGTGTDFPALLQVAALDSEGNLVDGVTIDFAAPGSGPSGTFADTGTNTTSANTDSDGIGTTSVFTANDQPGRYTVIASASGLGSANFNLEQVVRPTNDDFAFATTISSLPFNTSMDMTEATAEPGEFFPCSYRLRSVWYVFTPTEDTTVRVHMTGGQVGGVVGLYQATGPSISDLAHMTCSYNGSSTNIQLEVGKIYYLQVVSDEPGTLQVNFEQIFPPDNDNFADAEEILSLPFSAAVDNSNATSELNETTYCAFPFGSAWYSFTPSENMTLKVDTVGSQVWGAVSVFLATGPGISDLTSIICASLGPTNFQAMAGQTYYLRLDSSYGQPGILQINLERIISPANDSFADTEVISLPFSTTVDNTNASAETDEHSVCGSPFRSVWYAFTPSEDIVTRVQINSHMTTGAVDIFRADGSGISDLTFMACAFSNSPANIRLEAGQVYYFRVDTWGQADVLQFNVEQIFPPDNDNFADAEDISTLPFNVTVNNSDATIEPGEPLGCGSLSRSTWFSFTPTERTAVRANTAGSAVSATLSIYLASGPDFSDLSFLGCAGSNSTHFQLEAGITYYLQVDSFGQGGVIQINLEQLNPPSNDNFTNSEMVTGLPFSTAVDITDASNEPNEPQYYYYMYKTVWYSYTAPETSTVKIDTQGSSIAANLNVYQPYGSEIWEQTFLGSTTAGGSVTLLAEAGQTYHLQVGSISSQDGTIQINVRQPAPPLNDNLVEAQSITSLPHSATVDISDATSEPGEPQYCYYMNNTVWYSFTPAETIKVRADMLGSPINANLNIYQAVGPGFSNLQIMQCVNPGGTTSFLAEAGQTYYLQAGPAYGEAGSLTINLAEVPAITGRVTDAATGLPLSGNAPPYAFVTLQRVCGIGCFEYVNSQYADGEGRFLFDGYYYGSSLPSGLYQIEASANLYQTRQFGPFEFSGVNMDLGDVSLTPPAIISGRVVDPATGNTLRGAIVNLRHCNTSGCVDYVNSLYTGGNGQFLFNSFYYGAPLSGGSYELEISAYLRETKRINLEISDGEHRDIGDVFLASLVLDNFNRANGTIGTNWSGNKSRYRISNNRLHVRYYGSNTDMYWKDKFGADQEAFVTFVNVGETATSQSLLLKAQNSRTWGNGVLLVSYDATANVVRVWTWEWPKGWVKYGDDIPVTFEDGDTFRARARADGIVEVYRNEVLLDTRDVTAWAHYASGGYIGLWFIGAGDAIIDDFGGGTIP